MRKVCLTVIACLALVYPGVLCGQERAYELDELIVTAERAPTRLGEAPANVTILSREDIEQSGARTIVDIFEGEPGMNVSNLLGNPKRAQVDIRGYGEAAPQNVLFLVDGRRINSIDLSGTDLSQIPLEAIERVEIYRGPASVLYGDNASAGVVNIILKKGEGATKATLTATVGSYALIRPSALVSGQANKISYFAIGSTLDTAGYRHNNAFRGRDFLGNVVVDPWKNLTVTLKAGFHADRYGLPGALLEGTLRRGLIERKDSVYPFDHASTEDNFVDAEATARLGTATLFAWGLSYRNRHNHGSYYYTGGFTENRQKLETISVTPKLVFDQPIMGRKNALTVGWDYYSYPTTVHVAGRSSVGPSNTTTDIDRWDTGFYIHDRFFPIENFLLEAGYRKHRVEYGVRHTDFVNRNLSLSSDNERSKDAYRFSLQYFFEKYGGIFLTYARGFRFPVTDEFVIPGYCFFGFCQPTQIAYDLKPQMTNQFDAGIRFSPTTSVGGSITFFTSTNKNEIYFNPLLFSNMNYDRTRRTGIEANLFLKPFRSLDMSFMYSYTKATFDGGPFDGKRIPLVPTSKLGAKVSYMLLDNLTVNVSALARSNCYAVSDQANSQDKLAGYTTFDASLVWTWMKFKAILAGKNLTGKKYSEYGVYSSFANDVALYPSPERQVLFTLQYSIGE